MARSESQGLQIAVILLTMCVVGLAIATWVCYQSADANWKLKESADKTSQDKDTALKKEAFKAKAYAYMVGANPAITKDMITSEQKTYSDSTVDADLAKYEKYMQENPKATTEETKGLIRLPDYLIGAITEHSKQLAVSQDRETALTADKTEIDKRESARAAAAEQSMQKAVADLAKERTDFNAERDKYKKDLDDLRNTIAQHVKQLKDLKDKSDREAGEADKRVADMKKENDNLRDKLAGMAKDGPSYESPDGQITWVSQRQRVAWIDVGYADGLNRQTTFSVYDHDENGVSSAKRKARIEVIRVAEPHLSECRILDDEIKNPILPGDKIFTPTWSPGQHLHFALNGALDIDGDGRPDNNEVRSIIELNGGVVDAELKPDGTIDGKITIQTRYLIRGKPPSDKEYGAEEGKRAFDNWSTMKSEAEKYGVDIIEVSRFLGMMGWKAQERTTTLGTKRTATKRTDTGAPATEEVPASTEKKPTKTKPAAKTEDEDPFGAP